MHQTLARLEAIAGDAERLSSEEQPPARPWTAVVAEWTSLVPRSEGLDEAGSRALSIRRLARVRQNDEERQAAVERSERQHVQRVEQLIERAQKRSAAEDLTLREADRLARDLRSAIEAPRRGEPRGPAGTGRPPARRGAVIAPKLHDLREMDEWKRFANAAVQEELIAKAEALRVKYGFDAAEGPKEEDLDKAARELHDIQERWKSVAEAPRAQAQALWHRYRQAADPVQARLREFFSQRNEERKGNLDKKLALIARAEEIADSTDWIKTADELKKLQARVAADRAGAAPGHQDHLETVPRRVRPVLHAAKRRSRRAQGNLVGQPRPERGAVRARRGARRRRRSGTRGLGNPPAAGRLEEHRSGPAQQVGGGVAAFPRPRPTPSSIATSGATRSSSSRSRPIANSWSPSSRRWAPAEGSGLNGADPATLLEQVRSLRSRWNQSTPVVRQGADPLSARFVGALERTLLTHPEAFKGTELDIEPNRQKMEKLVTRVEGFLNEAAPPPANSSQALADMLREALASNTIGGRAGEESKWRTMAEDVRQAQASWSRLGPVPGESGTCAERALPQGRDKVLRSVPPQGPAAADRAARRAAGGDEVRRHSELSVRLTARTTDPSSLGFRLPPVDPRIPSLFQAALYFLYRPSRPRPCSAPPPKESPLPPP